MEEVKPVESHVRRAIAAHIDGNDKDAEDVRRAIAEHIDMTDEQLIAVCQRMIEASIGGTGDDESLSGMHGALLALNARGEECMARLLRILKRSARETGACTVAQNPFASPDDVTSALETLAECPCNTWMASQARDYWLEAYRELAQSDADDAGVLRDIVLNRIQNKDAPHNDHRIPRAIRGAVSNLVLYRTLLLDTQREPTYLSSGCTADTDGAEQEYGEAQDSAQRFIQHISD